MTPRRAWLGSVAFLVVVPGTVAGLVPWWIGGWQPRGWMGAPIAVPIGSALGLVGVAVLVHAFAEFATEGLGTPAPAAPPRKLVVTGAYRHVRNPMYAAILAILIGQALLLGDVRIAAYAAAVLLLFAAFVHLHEEPALRRRFGADYDEYVANVPRWLPRLTAYYTHRGRE